MVEQSVDVGHALSYLLVKAPNQVVVVVVTVEEAEFQIAMVVAEEVVVEVWEPVVAMVEVVLEVVEQVSLRINVMIAVIVATMPVIVIAMDAVGGVIHAAGHAAYREVVDLIRGLHHVPAVALFQELERLHARLEKHMVDLEKMDVKMENQLTGTVKKNVMVARLLQILHLQRDVMNTILLLLSELHILNGAAQNPLVDTVEEVLRQFHVRDQTHTEISNY